MAKNESKVDISEECKICRKTQRGNKNTSPCYPQRKKSFNINTKGLRCNPQFLEKTALKKPNVYYGHSQMVELVFAFLCRVMGCNGHPA